MFCLTSACSLLNSMGTPSTDGKHTSADSEFAQAWPANQDV